MRRRSNVPDLLVRVHGFCDCGCEYLEVRWRDLLRNLDDLENVPERGTVYPLTVHFTGARRRERVTATDRLLHAALRRVASPTTTATHSIELIGFLFHSCSYGH